MKKKCFLIIKSLLLFILLVEFKSLFVSIVVFLFFGGANADNLALFIQNMDIVPKVILMFIADLIYLSFIIAIYFKTLKNDFKSYFKKFLSNFEEGFKYYLIGLGIMIVSNIIIVIFINGAVAGNEEAVRDLIGKVPLYMIFSVSIYAPLTEELIFRKSVRDIISNKYIYVFISGFLFGLAHVIGNLNTALDLLYLIPYSSLGITFAYTYYKTKNIFSTIMIHCMHNSVAIILYLVAGV